MPLTALHGSGDDVIDATACSDRDWAAVHRVSPRAPLRCRACARLMHAKVSPRGTRFFAHDRKVADCPAAGETPLHRLLKGMLADTIRAAGWSAAVEATPGSSDIGGWRADVLAVDATTGRRVAFEVQLAALTIADARSRTARYSADEIQTIWLTTRSASWVWAVPSCRLVQQPDADDATATPGFAAASGLAKLVDDVWELPPPVDLQRVIAGILASTIVPFAIGDLREEVPHGQGIRMLWHDDATALVPSAHVSRGRKLAHKRERAEARTRAEAERIHADRASHRRNLDALYERQEHLVPIAVAHATDELSHGEHVWIGVPPTRLLPGTACGRVSAAGNEKTAQAATVWIGRARDGLRLFAVCAPVAGLVTTRLAASWQRRRVRVYVAEENEAKRVAAALRCSTSSLHLSKRPGHSAGLRSLDGSR
jgi:hypothetical protein